MSQQQDLDFPELCFFSTCGLSLTADAQSHPSPSAPPTTPNATSIAAVFLSCPASPACPAGSCPAIKLRKWRVQRALASPPSPFQLLAAPTPSPASAQHLAASFQTSVRSVSSASRPLAAAPGSRRDLYIASPRTGDFSSPDRSSRMSEPTMNTMEHGSTDPNISSGKRKREVMDTGDVQRLRSAHGGPNNFDVNIQATDNYGYDAHGMPSNTTDLSHIDQQLLQAVGNQNGVSDDNAMTAKAALAAHQPESKYPPPEPSFDNNGLGNNLSFGQDVGQVSMGPVQSHTSTAAAVYAAREAQAQAAQQISPKPTVGSAEWHQSSAVAVRPSTKRCRDAGLSFDDYDDEKSLTKLPVDESHNI
ncbi:hypothetical protein TEQG_05591 [Trichophyton equinum CBS 127.97]|uniref:Uncharacterized protein n=1 Tax=Trichophyton equinum (strain ATCC MYA-4606 / CBS 127.97) TaxID=559882 RepID=F2PXH5_TRIEC|nr:hypothetical protein TEQG_05591 [Trichophyton equinum CBS 127.97]